jgi:hypothetical protein
MTTGGRLLDFAGVCLTAAAVWVVAQGLWPYLGLVAALGALVALLLVVNLVDGIWFAIRYRRRRAFGAPTPQQRHITDGREGRLPNPVPMQ